ncbi:C45 family autoproteolytic acyltransferase/hydolase [Tenuibacillus multivorans]|uniref:Predicted choloylglycine hydrolase n=1 Tax=Tenuibacillus multivorans TaxID=237069 RepID=A0A1G9YGC3_9BACI|nr:C45 family peptidase [Tenuibacillus multivorans]GEL78528.1 choloylglycine hydrolase [Tenuibacillus multivorans]SDN08022.1 Predicted choloylglycine hydrolase [Tenuibacillus multivorans]
MTKVFSDVLTFRGNHYDFGFMQGELLRNSPILPNRHKQWASKRKRHFSINEQESIDILRNFIPGMLDEIKGLADALNWEMKDALREFGGYYIDYNRSGCSIFSQSDFLIRNYDSHPAGYEGRYVIYQPTDSGYAVIGPSMQITGRIDGMNEKGLVMGYNFTNRVGSDDGFVCNMIGRIILETCANVHEAIGLLNEIPHRTSFNYVLLDQNGESYVVEASPRSVAARKSSISTNHFELLTEENRNRMDDSIRRQELLKQIQNDSNVFQSFRLLNDTEQDIFSSKYDAWAGTLHTSGYQPKEKRAWIAIGSKRMPVIFDFDRFLNGEEINVTKIKGILAFDTPFANMEKLYE